MLSSTFSLALPKLILLSNQFSGFKNIYFIAQEVLNLASDIKGQQRPPLPQSHCGSLLPLSFIPSFGLTIIKSTIQFISLLLFYISSVPQT
jgi:hypothetical protein